MFLSVFEIFKVGIGPSSSHTMGPMTAATRFLEALSGREDNSSAAGIKVTLHGSLAFTGKGHATDRATILGLAGFTPESFDAERAEAVMTSIKQTCQITVDGLAPLRFDPPLFMEQGQGLRIRATYDNTEDRDLLFGFTRKDEMMILYGYYYTD